MSIPIKLNPLGLNKTNTFNIPLTFTALENNSSVKLIGENSENGIIDFSKMYYRTNINSPWEKYNNEIINLYNKGDYVQFWNKNNILTPGVFSYYAHFIMTGKISGSGNVQSLLNFDKYTNNYCFYSLFRDCNSLIYPPELLGKNSSNCYNSMFWGCKNLIKAPNLIDDIIYGQSYCQMFVDCSSLIYPAKMPKNIEFALNSKYAAFLSMYNGCSKLIETPDFIINDNEIPYRCFYGMFWGCTKLKTIKMKFTYQKIGQQSFIHMFKNCSSLLTAPALPATTLATRCYQEMFNGCSSLVTAPELPATTLVISCYLGMFKNCTSLVNAPELPATTLANNCYQQMFHGCTSLVTAPELPATTLTDYCYAEMFKNCLALTELNVGFTKWNDSIHATDDWVNSVASSGTFIKPMELQNIRGANKIPAGWNVINKISYIESTGTQYINTGYVFDSVNKGSELEIKILIPSGAGTSNIPFGARNDNYAHNALYLIGWNLVVGDSENVTIQSAGLPESKAAILRFYDGKFSINNGVEINTNILPATSYPFGLFAFNAVGGFAYGLGAKPGTRIYYCKFYENGTLVHYFIPVLDSIGVPCMYDTVSKNYYYNAGTGTFKQEKNFYEVQYLESTGTQYINTGIIPDFANGDSVEIKFFGATMEDPPKSIFGSRNVNNSISINALYLNGSNIVFGDSTSYTSTAYNYINEHTLIINNNEIIDNGNVYAQVTKQVTCEYPIYLFTMNDRGNPLAIYPGLKIYYWKYYHNGVLTQHLIPVLDENDVPCMYDTVTGLFYYNAGTDNFEYKTLFKKIQYIESTGTQYIDTGIKPDYANGDRTEISFYRASYSGYQPCVFGSRETIYGNGFYVLPLVMSANGTSHKEIQWESKIQDYTIAVDDNNIIIDGELLAEMPQRVTCTVNMTLFALRNGDGSMQVFYDGMKLYDWKYYHNDALAQHLIPVLDQDGIPCLYDTVSKIFKYNVGDGEFKVDQLDDYLTFTATENNSSVKLIKNGNPNNIELYYKTSLSSEFIPYTINTQISLSQGQYVKFWNKSNMFSNSHLNYYQFSMTGQISGSGNIQSLLNFIDYCPDRCFYFLFQYCAALTTAPKLPAMVVSSECYYGMFNDCTALTVAPNLPALTLAGECYKAMFYGCTLLTEAPELPATTLEYHCYKNMFASCIALTTAPDLPATTLANNCYESMFQGCTSLVTAPELPATTLADYCYSGMFRNCTSLVTAPELPALILSDHCYQFMFASCTALTKAPDLLATVLADTCYGNMFSSTALTEAPVLHAITLVNNCYENMFLGCFNLAKISVNFTSWHENATTNWLGSVSSLGTFIKPENLQVIQGANNIPENWETINIETIPLTLTAKQEGSTVKIIKNGTLTLNNLEYKTNNDEDWQSYSLNTLITLENINDYVQFRNTNTSLSTSNSNYAQFVMTGKIYGSGNVQSLLNFRYTATNYCFRRLFQNCSALITAPHLLAETAKEYSYASTFNSTGIKTPPLIKAQSMENYCGFYMFQACNNLVSTPDLPATSVGTYCYHSMFINCVNLVKAMNSLPATSLGNYCYHSMFEGCINLINVPNLLATSLKQQCYVRMFYNCISLIEVMEILPSTTLADSCYAEMFYNCKNIVTAPELPASTLVIGCYNGMFQYCNSLNYIKVGFTEWVNNRTNYWITKVSNTGIFECPQALDTTTITKNTSTILPTWTIIKY